MFGTATKENVVRVRKRGEGREDAKGPSVPAADKSPTVPAFMRLLDADLPETDEEGDGGLGDDEADFVEEDVREESLLDVPVLEKIRGDILVSSDIEFVSDREEQSIAETYGEVERMAGLRLGI